MADAPSGEQLKGAVAEAAARKFFEGEGLPYPVVPDAMVGGLKQLSPTLYSTWTLPGLWNVDGFLEAAVAREWPEGVAFGFEGHGVESWAFHYGLVCERLIVVLQLRWGGAYTDAETTGGRIDGSLAFVRRLLSGLEEAEASGGLTTPRRLAVLESDFVRPRWAWVEDGIEPSWDSALPVMFNALMSVRELSGRP